MTNGLITISVWVIRSQLVRPTRGFIAAFRTRGSEISSDDIFTQNPSRQPSARFIRDRLFAAEFLHLEAGGFCCV